MSKISLKKTWVSTSAWRGYEQPIFAVGGCNDTGSWPDSPARTDVRVKEIGEFKKRLKAAGIAFKQTICQSSNVFCAHVYVVVAKEDHEKAYEIAKEYQSESQNFYACEMLEEKEVSNA